MLLLVVAFAGTASAAKTPPHLKQGKIFVLPWQTTSSSVAIAPDGAPWFGASAPGALSLITLDGETEQVIDLDPNGKLVRGEDYGSTASLRFDQEGNLWFVRRDSAGAALVKRAPDGTETTVALPGSGAIHALAIGPEGLLWLTLGNERRAAIASVTSSGTVTSFPLAKGSEPVSLTAGADGALWFSEEAPGRIGRITTGGKISHFALGRGVHPREIVAGSGGALWFSENGRRGPHKTRRDRIGRITTKGKVTQFPIPFGGGTESLAADPRGPIWFSTEEGEVSSISSKGKVGRRACVGRCSPIRSLALAPDGSLWFAAEKRYEPCLECGGGTAILQQLEGAPVGEIPAGALAPAAALARASTAGGA
jgi:virginiamycin B lyase